MKSFTSFTQRETMLRCPRRFYHRYLDGSPQAKALRQLHSVRELGGHCIHRALADALKRIADGDRISDQTNLTKDALEAFERVIQRSKTLHPGVLAGGLQVAEYFNGMPCDETVRDWREIIPIALGNAVRLFHYFGFRSNNPYYTLEAEQEVTYSQKGRTRRFVMDVLVDDASTGVHVIDWKTHAITDADLRQIHLYQEYLLDARRARPTRVYGFAVNLLNEEIVEHHYRKFDELPSIGSHSGKWKSPTFGTLPSSLNPAGSDPYPPKASPLVCSICPFATLCPASTLAQTEFIYGP